MPESPWGRGPVMIKDLAAFLGRERRQIDKAIATLGLQPFHHGGDRRALWITAAQARRVRDLLARGARSRPPGTGRTRGPAATRPIHGGPRSRGARGSGKPVQARLDQIEGDIRRIVQAVDSLEHQIASLHFESTEHREVRNLITQEDSTLWQASHRALDEAITFVHEVASRTPGPRGRTIYVTYQGGRDPFGRAPILVESWWRALRGALDRGWNVVHLIRETDDGSVPLALVSAMLRLVGANGEYAPHIFKSYHLGFFPQIPDARGLSELIVAPGVAALELYATRHAEYLDGVKRYTSESRMSLLSEYVRTLKTDSALLIEAYGRRSLDFHLATTEADIRPGARGLYMHGLSAATMPPRVYSDRAGRLLSNDIADVDPTWVGLLCGAQRQRFQAIEQNLARETIHVRDVYSEEALSRYVATGIPARDDIIFARDHAPVPPTERLAHLECVIQRLERYHPHYEIGIMPRADAHQADLDLETFWMYKEGYGVLLETWRRGAVGSDDELDLAIKNAAMAQVFGVYFEENLWQRLEPRYRGQQGVIEILRALKATIR